MTKDSLALAIEALSWMAYEGISERSALFRAAEQLRIQDPGDLRNAFKLIIETTRFQNKLDFLISQAIAETMFEQAPHGITSLLRIIAYEKFVAGARERRLIQLANLGRRILGWKTLHRYEGAIGRIASRATPPTLDLSDHDRISLETCHPRWLVEKLTRTFGRADAIAILRRNLKPMPTYARLNTVKVTSTNEEEKIVKLLHAERVQQVPDVLRLSGSSAALRDLAESGKIVIQDLASITATLVAAPEPGDTVLDVCAAPGNKTTHLAALMLNRGTIYSIDISGKRLSHWTREIDRTGTTIAAGVRADARRIPLNLRADVVLLDAPCSNTGVLARTPSIKWRIAPTLILDLARRQRAILREASEHVKPEGTLVYCTCSILPEENELVIDDFLSRNPSFELIRQTPFLGTHGLRGFDKCQRFYTHLHDCNGYFIAKMRRHD